MVQKLVIIILVIVVVSVMMANVGLEKIFKQFHQHHGNIQPLYVGLGIKLNDYMN